MAHVLVNLAFLNTQPTGLMIYGLNVVPHLRSLNPTLLTPLSLPDGTCYPVSATMTADQGSKGHARRLLWTQFRLPALYRTLDASLLFSPIPELPLSSPFTPNSINSIVTVHDLIPLRFPKRLSPLTLYSRYYVPQVLRQATHILANSTATAQDVVDFFGIPPTKITPIPLAYDADHFRVLNLPKHNYFLYLGRPDPHKNLHRVIDAFAMLPRRNCELWMAGTPDPNLTPLLRQQAQDLGIAERVKILDYVPYDELPNLLNQAIALVFPSLWEGFGLPVLEAMACGTPVITSNLSSLPEVAGDAALLVDPYDVGAIAHAMTTILTDNTAQTDLRNAGLQRVKHFSWERTGELTAQVLKQYG